MGRKKPGNTSESGGNSGGRNNPPNQQQKKEGDWTCRVCGNSNFAKRFECNRCGKPKIGSAPRPDQFPSLAGPSKQPTASQGAWGGSSQQSQQQKSKEDHQSRPQTAAPVQIQHSAPQPQIQQSTPQLPVAQPAESQKKEKFDWKKDKQEKKKQKEVPLQQQPQVYQPQIQQSQAPQTQPQMAAQPAAEIQKKEKFDWKKDKQNKQKQKEMSSREQTPGSPASAGPTPTQSVSNLSQQYPVLVQATGANFQGTRGRTLSVEVNFLPILLQKMLDTAYHWDVSFDPERPKKLYYPALEKFFENKCHFAFDGKKNVYTARKFSETEIEEEVVVNDVNRGTTKTFKVKVQYATEVNMHVLKEYNAPGFQRLDKPSQALQVLDVVLRSVFKKDMSAVVAGRAIYYKPDNPFKLPEGMELWLGLFQSAILGRKQLYLNVDVAHKAFPSAQWLEDLLWNEFYDRRSDKIYWNQFEQHLKMLNVEYTQNKITKIYSFNGLKKSAREESFTLEDGRKMTVQQYFEKEKGYKLKYPDWPLLHVGSRIRNVYLPIEFCSLPAGQATNKKCTPNVVAAMIKESATSTDVRKRKIQNLLQKIDHKQSEIINEFGIQVNKNPFEKVDARLIDAPTIQYRDRQARVNKGVWRNETFIDADAKYTRWAIVNCDGDRVKFDDLRKLKSEVLNQSRRHNIQLDADPKIIDRAVNPQKFVEFFGVVKREGYTFIIAIINDWNDCYARVKQAAELKVGILTQCIKTFTLQRKMDPATVGNILLKINAKLNGVNHQIQGATYNSNTMFVGGDVTHPSPDQRHIPSVVGVAASYDATGFKYACSYRLQDPREEMIRDFANIIKDHMNFYKSKNGRYPQRIFYFRDGVSDGQFQEVLNVEMKAIKEACKLLGVNVKTTFIVVQKRHHTRFFPINPNFAENGKNNNVQAGTVVDKDIVHPHQFQFYLASHTAIQGVTKPAKYCVIYDENYMNPDEMEAMTYDLCHLFTRCNRSVSYPAPTYYAHLVAARGKQYTLVKPVDTSNLEREYNARKILPDITSGYPMFFV